jgi:hypothetical protein
MSKQSSIEWLVQQMKLDELFNADYFINQSKQMHKEEIEDAYGDGINAYRVDFCNREEYYQKTYGSSPKTSDN